MNVHSFLDDLTISLSALFLSKNKFFCESIDSETFPEHLRNIRLHVPEINGEGLYEVKAVSLAGELNPAFKIARWIGDKFPVIIYHHGSGENPFDRSFKKILLSKRSEILANLVVVRAPFNKSAGEYLASIKKLSNFVAMLSVSVKLIEHLVCHFRQRESSEIVVSGISLGGWVTNIHRAYFNSADTYKPLMAGALLADVFTDSSYKILTGALALENKDKLHKILNFEQDFYKIKDNNVFPLLGLYDRFIRYDVQKQCYRDHLITAIEKGHITGALAFHTLREHIIGDSTQQDLGIGK